MEANQSNLKKDSIVIVLFFLALIVVNGILVGTGKLKFGTEGFGIMVAAALTIALYSFLYQDNPIFKMAEHFYVGVATAYLFIVTWFYRTSYWRGKTWVELMYGLPFPNPWPSLFLLFWGCWFIRGLFLEFPG